MYVPDHFAIRDTRLLHSIIQHHPLGALVTSGSGGLDADHLPFELDADRGVLTAHVARANPLWQRCGAGMDVLVIFRGAESYISPSWYPSKHLLHRQVPTWNYEVVHAFGHLTVQDEERFVRGVVARLTRRHEAAEPQPWKMSDSAPDFIDRMLAAIVGIEVAISRLEGKAKLSQNRDDPDRIHAAQTLQARGKQALADAMQGAGRFPG